MEVTVSLSGSRNLSTSALIARHLYSTLQLGSAAYQGSPIDVQDVVLMATSAENQLAITLRNSQTQTVLYARSVPMSYVAEAQRPVDCWVEVYPPGDPRDSHFDETPPRPDAPQVYLSVRCSGLARASCPADTARASWCSAPPDPLGSSLRQSFASSSSAPPEGALRQTFEKVEDIKAKVSALADGKRQAESGEYQLQIVQHELEEARSGIEQAELELYQLKTTRDKAEQEKLEAQEAVNKARETLRQHEQSILELRLSCEESERKLAQVFADCSQQQSAMDSTVSNFGREIQSMADELERWRGETQKLSGSLESCEQRVQEIQARGELDFTQVCLPDEGEDVQALRSQLDKTSAELEVVRQSALDQAARVEAAEQECQSAVERLASAEAAAENEREGSKQKAAELRTEAEAAERELLSWMSKVAVLEGQVGENQNQLHEMDHHVEDLMVRVHSSTDELRDTGVAIVLLKESFAAHELDITRKALDADLEDVNGELAAMRRRQELLKVEAESEDAEAEALEEEEQKVSRRADEELQSAEAEAERREKKRLELVSENSALEEELVEARRQFCVADEEATVARAAVATAAVEAEQRELGLEEVVEMLRSELDEQHREVEELMVTKRASISQLDETTGLLPQSQAEVERLRGTKSSTERKREELEVAVAEVCESLEEQEAEAAAFSERAAEYQEQLDAAKGEAKEVEEKEAELRSELDAAVAQREKHEEDSREVAAADCQRYSSAQGLEAMRSRRAQLTAEMAELEIQCQETAKSLAEIQAKTDAAESSHAERMRAPEAEQQRLKEEQAEMDKETQELEEQLAVLEAELEVDRGEQMELDETLAAGRAEAASASHEMQLFDEELKARRSSLTSQTEALAELQERTSALEGRTGQLRAELSTAEVDEALAGQLRAECAAAEAACEGKEVQEGLGLVGAGSLLISNADLDRQIEYIDELERDILLLTGTVEERLGANAVLEQELGCTDREVMEAMERTADQRARAAILRRDIERLEKENKARQGDEPDCSEEDIAAEERKVALLREQLACREEAIATATAEAKEARALVQALQAELRQLQDEQGSVGDKLSYSVELGGLQDSTIERLQEDVQKVEGEAEVLTLGLHDAEQRSACLQKENQLMRQQVEGMYSGSLHDWAAEVDQLKGDDELQRSKDELSHWQQVAQEAERELETDVAALRQQHAEAERALQETLQELQDELAKWQEKLKEAGSQSQKSGGAVHSVPAALHGFVQPVRMPPPHVRRRALIIGCNYTRSHAPLRGCANDAWNVQCLLRHSFRYSGDQVHTLIEGYDACPAPERRRPTKANILAGLQWLVGDATPCDSLLLYFAGYGTQQPRVNDAASHEAYLVPCDFADDLPTDFFSRPADSRLLAMQGSFVYRLLPLAEISRALASLPTSCKVTVILDCCHGQVPAVDIHKPAPVTSAKANLDEAQYATDEAACSQARVLDLPPLPMPPSLPLSGPLACSCYCYSACQSEQFCIELLIEGYVQGAFTWAFVKALTAGHMDTTVARHCKALDRIMLDLQMKFGWIDQAPVLQLSALARQDDLVLMPELPPGVSLLGQRG